MFTYIYIYLTLYVITYFFLLNYLVVICNFKNIESLYLNSILNSLKKYTNLSPAWFLLFTLTGLPPVGFFLIKFNILLTIYSNLNTLIQILIFFNILLTMFFYLQVFNSSNISNNINVKNLKKNFILKKLNFTSNKKLFTFYVQCTFFIYLNIMFVYYFADVYLIYYSNFI
jgi:hypothetical protein